MDELLAAIRQLPLDKRLELIERAGHEAAADTPQPPVATRVPALLGLLGDDPDLVDRVCASAYEARQGARMRGIDG
jgi:hypothetical protein